MTAQAGAGQAGFDDVADAADYRPPLTTVRQDFDLLGERAVDVLVSGIEAAWTPRLELIADPLGEMYGTKVL